MYLPSKLYEIDLECSHLSDEEIAELIAQTIADEAKEREAAKSRREKQSTFRFGGGMC